MYYLINSATELYLYENKRNYQIKIHGVLQVQPSAGSQRRPVWYP